MRQLAELKEATQPWRELEIRCHQLEELIDLALEEDDSSLEASLTSEAETLASEVERLGFQLALGGEYDSHHAMLSVHAGAGGTDSQDWAQMLMRMYLRWAERRGLPARLLDSSPGEEAGLKSATLEIQGHYTYGFLRAERGVHRLVRLSPFDSQHLRHTSFALVEVLPAVEQELDIAVNPEDLRIETFRSSGHGGQNVQKVATAVRIVHLPTGITATCQNERSQIRNKDTALKILQARILERELARRAEERARLKGEHHPAEWGNQIRSYVLHPYKLVKDHRTDFESGNVEAVLDGNLDPLLDAFMKWRVGKE